MKRHLRTVLFMIAASVLGVVVQKFVLRKDGSPVLAAVVGAIVGALASFGGGTDGKGEAEAARRGKPARSGDAPPEIGGTEDAIEDRAQIVASEEQADAGEDSG